MATLVIAPRFSLDLSWNKYRLHINRLNTMLSTPRPAGLGLSNWREHPNSQWSFQHVMEILPTAAIAANNPRKLAPQHPGLDFANELVFPMGDGSLLSLLESTSSDGLLVCHNGEITGSWFALHCDPLNPHLLFSVSKSITATVAGIMQDQGLLDPSAPVSEYLDMPGHSAYADCSVQHVLDMAVALDFEENYDSNAEQYSRYRRASGWNPVNQTQPLEGLRSFILGIGRNDDEHGNQFRYLSPNSDLLGMILASAGGQPFPALLTELLWKPMGASHDANITLDYFGEARSAGGISATIFDLARIGQLVCDDGRNSQGRQVLSPAWITEITSGGNRDAWRTGDFAYIFPNGNYRNKWYQTGNPYNAICAIGIHGQYLYIDPLRNVVIARVASQAEPVNDPMESAIMQSMAMIAGLY